MLPHQFGQSQRESDKEHRKSELIQLTPKLKTVHPFSLMSNDLVLFPMGACTVKSGRMCTENKKQNKKKSGCHSKLKFHFFLSFV